MPGEASPASMVLYLRMAIRPWSQRFCMTDERDACHVVRLRNGEASDLWALEGVMFIGITGTG
jgi:hypothetical protein